MKKISYLLILITIIGILIAIALNLPRKEEKGSLERIQEKGTFILGLDDSFPPMGYRNENNEIVGFDIDLAKEVCSRLGVELVIQPISWSANEKELNSYNIDCIWNGMSITDERKAAMCLSMPYMKNRMFLVTKDSSVTSIEGKKVGVQTGSSAEKALDESDLINKVSEVVGYQDNVTAFMDLEIGGIDAVFVDEVLANYYIASNSKKYNILEEVVSEEKYAIGFRKNDIELKDKIEEILYELKNDGTLGEISKKWFGKDITIIGE